jgi:hypothetical protein
MGLPGHRRTSSNKRRRASHFALVKPTTTVEKTGLIHRCHCAAPGATEYNGKAIHVKGRERKLQKLINKTKPRATETAKAESHEGHNHA